MIRLILSCFLLVFVFTEFGNILAKAEEATDETGNETENEVTELDLGDYQITMAVGDKQLLTVTVLPASTTTPAITYESSDESVAKINGIGRITALKPGTTTIRAVCLKVRESFLLTVKEASAESTESTQTSVAVTDIEIADYEDELAVDKTMTLTATVLPSAATDSAVTYTSSNTAVATVSSTGEVKGNAPGNVQILVQAGNVTKTVPLTVKIATTAINISSTYVVLGCGESCQLSAQAQPSGTSQSITYQSVDTGVASVSSGGLVTAKQTGSTTILVSNGDMSNAVTVIVNAESATESQIPTSEAEIKDAANVISSNQESTLISSIGEKKQVTVQIADYPVLSKNILKALYESGNTLRLESSDYTLIINGKDIVNYENELNTDLSMKKVKNGISFELGEENNLPGTIQLQLKTEDSPGYLYLYNPVKEKYEKLDVAEGQVLSLDTAGTYQLTSVKLQTMPVSILILAVGIFVSAALAAGCILLKKKYWFW